MRTKALAAFVLLLLPTQGRSQGQTPIDTAVVNGLAVYVRAHHQSPEAYVVDKFKNRDVVFLGENHYIKHDVVLVQRLIPLLYQAGVYTLGTEHARRVDQAMIDSLLEGAEYDEALARRITFLEFVHWGYQEYVDIYRSAWALNHELPTGSRHFRILGLNNSPDWSLINSQEDRDNREVLLKVWHGEDEGDWAQVLLDSVIAKGEKALVCSGIHHAFTEYRQPVVIDGRFVRFGDVRCGNHVFNTIGNRAFTVFLHAPWFGKSGYDTPQVCAADGYIDALLDRLDSTHQNFGIDMKGTPFGELTGETSLYSHGYTRFTLDTIYDGYVCQGQLSSYEGVTPIRGFIDAENLGYARAHSPNPEFRVKAVEDFYNVAREEAQITKYLPVCK